MRARISLLSVIALAATGLSATRSAAGQDGQTSTVSGGDTSASREASNPQARRGQPEGYLGISFTCSVKRQYGPEGLTIYHYGYPAVASVEPGSPAARAGIAAGDTIVAYDSQDVLYRKIVLAKLLRPGARLAVRVRRNGAIKDLSARIARRPITFVDMSVRGVRDPLPPLPATPPVAADPPDGGLTFAPIGGAEVVRITPDLRDALGVPGGLLVITVDAGTPAADAGIRPGDVIVAADGQTVEGPVYLIQMIQRAESTDRALSLRVVRRHRERTVVLK